MATEKEYFFIAFENIIQPDDEALWEAFSTLYNQEQREHLYLGIIIIKVRKQLCTNVEFKY